MAECIMCEPDGSFRRNHYKLADKKKQKPKNPKPKPKTKNPTNPKVISVMMIPDSPSKFRKVPRAQCTV